MFKKRQIDFLLTLLGKAPDDFSDEPFETFTEADWFEFLTLARAYGVAPILYKRLIVGGFQKKVPGWLIKKLGVLYVSGAKRQMALRDEFAGILEKLNDNRISCIVLKGPHLAECVYRDWALRPMNDLDILVRQRDLAKAVSTMEDLGYSKGDIGPWDYRHHLPPFIKEGFAPVELHTEIVTVNRIPCSVDHDSIWQRTKSIEIGDISALTLSLEDLLLHLSLHICQHEFLIRPIHIYDVAALIREYEGWFDWVALQSIAHKWRATKALYLTLAVTRELTGASIPEEVFDHMKPRGHQAGFTRAASVRVLGVEGIVHPNFMDMLEAKGLRAKMKLLYERKLSRETVSAKYPIDKNPRLIGLYYGLHIITLLGGSLKLAFQFMRHGKKKSIQREQIARSMRKWLTGDKW